MKNFSQIVKIYKKLYGLIKYPKINNISYITVK